MKTANKYILLCVALLSIISFPNAPAYGAQPEAAMDTIGNPRVMVLIDERIGDRNPFLSTTEGIVLGVFEKAGYRPADPDQVRALLNNRALDAHNDYNKIMDAARKLNADVIVLGKAYGSTFAQQGISGHAIFGVRSTVQLKAIMTKTGYMIGSQTVEKRSQGLTPEDGAIRGFKEAAAEAADSIVHKIAYALIHGSAGEIEKTIKLKISNASLRDAANDLLKNLQKVPGADILIYQINVAIYQLNILYMDWTLNTLNTHTSDR